MFPALRTLAAAKLAWFRLANTLAPGAVATTHTRRTKDRAGNPLVQQVVRQPRYVCTNGAMLTGVELLKMHLAGARRLAGTPALWDAVVMTDAGVPELPPVFTSGRELAEKRRVSERTTRNHLRELKACGFITRTKFRGTNAEFCLWINPDFAWETALAAPKTTKMQASEPAATEGQGKNLPLTEVLEALEAQKSEISGVEKLLRHEYPGEPAETGSPLTGSAGSPSGCQPSAQAAKSGAGAAGEARWVKFRDKARARALAPEKAAALATVEAFWSYAKATVYKKVVFTPEAERLAKNAIWQGVFHGFQVGEPAQWQQWLKPLLRRLELAADWLARNPSRFAPLPYAEVLDGAGYFDATNQRGFAGTLKWWQAEQAKTRQGALERALDEAVAEMGQRKVLDAGAPRRYQASKRARQKSLPELHRYHHTKLRRLGGDEALVRFAARLQAAHILSLS